MERLKLLSSMAPVSWGMNQIIVIILDHFLHAKKCFALSKKDIDHLLCMQLSHTQNANHVLKNVFHHHCIPSGCLGHNNVTLSVILPFYYVPSHPETLGLIE